MNQKLHPPMIPKRELAPQISTSRLLEILKEESGLVPSREYGSGAHLVLIHPDAREEIESYFKFGKGTRAVNRDEQQATLYGHLFSNEYGNATFLITRAAYIYPSQRNRTYVATSGSNEDDFMEYRLRLEQAVINDNEYLCNTDQYGNVIDVGLKYCGPSRRLGMIHTHPGFGCFFSAIDRASNESTSSLPYVYLVCDPIRMDYQAMAGAEGDPTRIVFLTGTHASGRNESDHDSDNSAEKGSGIRLIAKMCRSFLKQKKVKGQFRMYFDADGKAHIKFHARFFCPDGMKREFEMVKSDEPR